MQEPKILRQRKQSLNKISDHNSKQSRSRSSSSLPKKTTTPVHASQGSYLLGWGHLPFLDDTHQFKKVGKNVIKYSVGDKHIVYVNHKYEAYGAGQSQFGQLGYQQVQSKKTQSMITPILQDYLIQDVYCTPYCSFFITNRDEIFGCGLNNRGQLGIGTTSAVTIPTKISLLSRKPIQKNDKLKNQSITIAERCTNSSSKPFYTDKSEDEGSLLNDGEYIVSISGGPYHTLALSNRGRVFYSGNIYKRSSIANDEFTTSFTELNLKKIGKVQMIKAGLTSIGLLNNQGNLFLLGVISENIVCDEPYNTGISCVIDFAISSHCIFILGNNGQTYTLQTNRKSIKTFKNQASRDMKEVHCGLDFTVFVDQKNNVSVYGENVYNIANDQSKKSHYNEPKLVNFGNLYIYGLRVSSNFLCGFCERLPLNVKKQTFDSDQSKKIEELQKQNKILKDLLKKQNQMMKTNIEKQQPKFDIHKSHIKGRTFDSSMEIPFEELILGKQISEGGYGIIYQATWRKTTVAVKIFKIDQNSQNSIKDFINECHAMEALRHPNIVMFLGACTKPPNFAIVLEFCQGGTLWSILQKGGELGWQDKRNFALDTAKGMNYLHERPTPVLHRDLKSLNLLLDDNKRVKLADFGWTKGLQNYMTGKIGTYQWMAPEVVSSHQYTEKADVFSFGIILWEIASRQAPYRNIPGVQVAHDVLHKELRPVIPKKTPEPFASLMKRCWDKNPDKRPCFSEIIDQIQRMKLPFP